MPELGDMIREAELGFNSSGKMIWVSCLDCGRMRWVRWRPSRQAPLRCHKCGGRKNTPYKRGKLHPLWRGGHFKTGQGYIMTYLTEDDFFHLMAKANNWVFEHRLVMAKHLGRCLHRWEIVHHKNGIKDDNRIENLQLVSDDRHRQITLLENRIHYLEKRVGILRLENRGLRERC